MKILYLLSFIVMVAPLASVATTCDGNEFLSYPEQYKIAYVAGVFDAFELYEPKISKCIGPKVKISQLSDTLMLHYKNNPQSRHLHCLKQIKIAIKEIWKCPG